MKLKSFLFALCLILSSCAGGTRGTGAMIDRKFSGAPETKTEPDNGGFFDYWFGKDCSREDEDCR